VAGERAAASTSDALWRCQAADACTVACYLVSCTRTFCQCPQQAPEPVLVVGIDLSPGEGMESAIRSADGAGAGATASGGRCTRAVHGMPVLPRQACLPARQQGPHSPGLQCADGPFLAIHRVKPRPQACSGTSSLRPALLRRAAIPSGYSRIGRCLSRWIRAPSVACVLTQRFVGQLNGAVGGRGCRSRRKDAGSSGRRAT